MRRFFSFFVFILIINISNVPANAESPKTISELIERALKRSDFIASLKIRIDVKMFAAAQARAWQNPIVGLLAGQKRVFPAQGPLYEVSVTQPFIFPGKQNLHGEILDIESELNKIRATEGEVALTHDVIRLAYAYRMNANKKKFSKNRQKRFQLIQSYLKGNLFPSPEKQAERHIVEARLTNLATEALQIEVSLARAYEQLNLYVGLDAGASPTFEVPWLQGTIKIDKKEWLKTVTTKNFDLAKGQLSVRASLKEKELAEKKTLPDMGLSAFYREEKGNESERAAGLGISLPLPLFNQNGDGIQSAEKQLEAEEQLLRFSKRQLESQLKILNQEFDIAQQSVRHYPKATLESLEQKLRQAESEFRKGRVSLLTFLELDTEAAETNSRVLDAQSTLVDKFLSLLFLKGERNAATYFNSNGGIF